MPHVIPEPLVFEPVVFEPEPVPEPDEDLRAILVPGLPARLDDATHRRCFDQALAMVAAGSEGLRLAGTTPRRWRRSSGSGG